jgi:NADH-quinone oxidoreductase subunit G
VLFGTDPVRDYPDRPLWERALHHAGLVVAHASVLTDGLREHANVIFPTDSYAEKQGTVVHPDGRIQRLRRAIAHPGEVRAGWSVIADIASRIGYDLGVSTTGDIWEQLVAAVPFYAGLTLEEIGGHGVRWPARQEAAALPAAKRPVREAPERHAPVDTNGGLKLGTYRPIWAAPECEISPALHFAIPHQQVELSPEDARRLNIANGEDVEVSQNGTNLNATAHVRTGVPPGVAFLAAGIARDSANQLTERLIEVTKR